MAEIEIWAIVAAIAAAISALSAMVSIIITYMIKKQELRTGRPYFMVGEKSSFKKGSNNTLNINLIIKNIGKRAASNFDSQIIFCEKSLTANPIFNARAPLANDLPPDSNPKMEIPPLTLATNVPPHFVILLIKYSDLTIDETFTQIFYFRWDGVQNNNVQTVVVHATESEKQDIVNYLRGRNLIGEVFSWI